jgi:hypothetical protein
MIQKARRSPTGGHRHNPETTNSDDCHEKSGFLMNKPLKKACFIFRNCNYSITCPGLKSEAPHCLIKRPIISNVI